MDGKKNTDTECVFVISNRGQHSLGNCGLDGFEAGFFMTQEAIIFAVRHCLLVHVQSSRVDAKSKDWCFLYGHLLRDNESRYWGVCLTEHGRMPSPFLASSILAPITITHLSFYKI